MEDNKSGPSGTEKDTSKRVPSLEAPLDFQDYLKAMDMKVSEIPSPNSG